MSNDQSWMASRLAEAGNHQPTVTESVLARMENLLNGQLGERQLSKSDLAGIAAELIAGMVRARPDPETDP